MHEPTARMFVVEGQLQFLDCQVLVMLRMIRRKNRHDKQDFAGCIHGFQQKDIVSMITSWLSCAWMIKFHKTYLMNCSLELDGESRSGTHDTENHLNPVLNRHLASLQYDFKVAINTVPLLFPQVCQAIVDEYKDEDIS